MKQRIIQIMVLTLFFPIALNAQNYTRQRNEMVEEQIIRRGIKDPQVVQAMRSVKRHEFVPEHNRRLAYSDRPLPIGYEQTISQPYIVALMTKHLNLDKGDKVLEVGTGSGYQAAVLAEITSNVYSIEIVKELGERARKTLQEQGYDNIRIKIGDGYQGWEEHAPFDGIIVTASPSDVPEPLKKQLAEGGKMVIPVGGPIFQNLVLLEKENGEIKKRT